MTIFQKLTPILFIALFIILHFIFYGIKNAKNNKKIKEKNPINEIDNYQIIKINESNFIARYEPTKQYIYFHPINKKSILVPSPISSELRPTISEAFDRLDFFIDNLKNN